MKALATQTLKLGTHRGNRRIWLDHSEFLTSSGFHPGQQYTAVFSEHAMRLKIDPHGKTKVSKKTKGGKLHPIIDLNNAKIGAMFPDAEQIVVEYRRNEILMKAVQR